MLQIYVSALKMYRIGRQPTTNEAIAQLCQQYTLHRSIRYFAVAGISFVAYLLKSDHLIDMRALLVVCCLLLFFALPQVSFCSTACLLDYR